VRFESGQCDPENAHLEVLRRRFMVPSFRVD
jgi:hypothetical protein